MGGKKSRDDDDDDNNDEDEEEMHTMKFMAAMTHMVAYAVFITVLHIYKHKCMVPATFDSLLRLAI